MSAAAAAGAPARRPGVGAALRAAFGDFYRHAWRLLLLNVAFAAAAVVVALSAAAWRPSLVLLVALGPLGAAFFHCAVALAQTGELAFADAVDGLRLHWRRGLALGAAASVVFVAGVYAAVFYARSHALAWPLAFLVAYVLGLFAVYQLVLWPLAVFERERPLREVARRALAVAARRPTASVGLGLAIALVNLAGTLLAVMPLLTLTIAYSFLAAAHFALPRSPEREAAV
jgi:hypothetical protein